MTAGGFFFEAGYQVMTAFLGGIFVCRSWGQRLFGGFLVFGNECIVILGHCGLAGFSFLLGLEARLEPSRPREGNGNTDDVDRENLLQYMLLYCSVYAVCTFGVVTVTVTVTVTVISDSERR